jgi:hypothetical protein
MFFLLKNGPIELLEKSVEITVWPLALDSWRIGPFFYQLHEMKQTRGPILGRNWNKSLKSFPPCYLQEPLLKEFSPPPPPPPPRLEQKWIETGL